MGTERIIAIETVPERVALARQAGAIDIIGLKEEDVLARIKDITNGQGADAAIDCIGMEATPGTACSVSSVSGRKRGFPS